LSVGSWLLSFSFSVDDIIAGAFETMNHPTVNNATKPNWATAVLVLDDGSVFWGQGVGSQGQTIGEVCFNTSITGYQEILTDPSYAGQIITFTFPHIGNVGTNTEDSETVTPAARGLILRKRITKASNYRSESHLNDWLKRQNLIGISGVDTRRLTRHIRDHGAATGVICHADDGDFDLVALHGDAQAWPGLEGMDLAREVSCKQSYEWDVGNWQWDKGFQAAPDVRFDIVAVDFGIKRNILRCLTSQGCKVTVVPAHTSAEEILAHKPDGVFLSNGPGDPAATGVYAQDMVQGVLDSGLPMFGICLGHQILALTLGAETEKMYQGHRGANQPVKDLETGKVEITSQNHGFVVKKDSLPDGVVATHVSLFDGVLEGLKVAGKPVFSVQYHPEASPGPQDSHYLFQRFVDLMAEKDA
jgi:carbamoyl-phosphate synthase small subunit